jgi:hypothetical protein
VIDEPRAVAELLGGSMLGGREVDTINLSRSGERIFWVSIDWSELLDAWWVGRSLLDQTGRWVTLADGYGDGRLIDLDAYRARVTSMADTPARVCALAADEALTAMRASRSAWDPGHLALRLEFQLNATKRRCGVAPRAVDVLAALPQDVGDEQLDRWLFDWEEQRQPTIGPESAEHLKWFALGAIPPLMFLPTGRGAETFAYTGSWLTQGPPGSSIGRLIAIVNYWEKGLSI